MTSAALALLYLAIAVHLYQDAKRNGQWSWVRFFSVLAATGVFIAAFIVPVVRWGAGSDHPRTVVAIMLSGIFVFVVALVVVLRKMPRKTPPAEAPAGRIP